MTKINYMYKAIAWYVTLILLSKTYRNQEAMEKRNHMITIPSATVPVFTPGDIELA